MADLVGHLTKFNQNGDYNFLVNDFYPRYYLPILSDPTMDNSDGDAMDDSSDDEPLYHDPDPLSDSNILSSEIKYIPLQKVKSFTGKIGRQFAKKWDCDVYISILKSCDCDDDIFVLTNENQSFSEVFAISDELKKKLNNGEKEYSNSFGHVPNEEAAHTGKLETDQLVPEFFDQDSSYYYGCWYHNYCQEMAMYNDYVQQIGTNWSRAMQAVIIYNIATSALQNAVLSSANNTYTVSKSDYANGAKEYITNQEINKGILKGSVNGLTKDEIRMVDDLLNEGKNVEIIPRSDVSKRPDFLVNGVKTELKTLNGSSLNTPVTRIQDGFKQGAETVLIDARGTSITKAQADIIIERALGVYKGQLPGNVEIWTQGGVYRW